MRGVFDRIRWKEKSSTLTARLVEGDLPRVFQAVDGRLGIPSAGRKFIDIQVGFVVGIHNRRASVLGDIA
jgi:hypothetical protein